MMIQQTKFGAALSEKRGKISQDRRELLLTKLAQSADHVKSVTTPSSRSTAANGASYAGVVAPHQVPDSLCLPARPALSAAYSTQLTAPKRGLYGANVLCFLFGVLTILLLHIGQLMMGGLQIY